MALELPDLRALSDLTCDRLVVLATRGDIGPRYASWTALHDRLADLVAARKVGTICPALSLDEAAALSALIHDRMVGHVIAGTPADPALEALMAKLHREMERREREQRPR